MSKEIDWGIEYGEGDIVVTCDSCLAEQKFHFEEKRVDYSYVQKRIKSMGWVSRMYRDHWKDFCCNTCRKEYEEKHNLK